MKKSNYDKIMEENDERLRLNKKRNYKLCKNLDKDECILWSACNDCYYYNIDLICPYCERKIPNTLHLTGEGCKWCQKL